MVDHEEEKKREKREALRRYRALNPRPQRVRDPAFTGDDPFFDPCDLMQVKYEMLRRVSEEGHPVSAASDAFGFSRPSFYEAKRALEEEGLPGLLPKPKGPRRAHKLSAEVMGELDAARAENPRLSIEDLVELILERFGLRVHPRSIERALARRKKGAPRT